MSPAASALLWLRSSLPHLELRDVAHHRAAHRLAPSSRLSIASAMLIADGALFVINHSVGKDSQAQTLVVIDRLRTTSTFVYRTTPNGVLPDQTHSRTFAPSISLGGLLIDHHPMGSSCPPTPPHVLFDIAAENRAFRRCQLNRESLLNSLLLFRTHEKEPNFALPLH